MENMHFAKFLGTADEVFYNGSSFGPLVNINMCDMLRPDSSPDMNIGETDIIDNYNAYDFYRGKKSYNEMNVLTNKIKTKKTK
jgi:hypothetical protein